MLPVLRLRRVTRAALLAASAAAWTGCGDGADLGIGSVLVVASVEVTPASITLFQQQTHTFLASPRTSSGVPVTGRAVAWSSSDPAVASIGADGTVRALAPGVTRITARVDGVSGFSDLTVSTIPVDVVELLPKATTVVIGSTVQLTANVLDADGGVLTGRPLVWSSSEVLFATVSNDGLVTTHGVGQVTITASVEGKSGAATITVGPRPAAKLGFLTPPADAVAGVAISPAVQVAIQDATGATATAATNTVTLALGPGPLGATLGGTLSAAAVNGVATFPNLSITKAGTGYTLVATSANLTDASSGPFIIRAAAGARVDITTQPPTGGTSATPLSPQPVVRIVDQFGNPVVQSGIVVTASLASGTGTLTNATATTGPTGAAEFNGLAINGVAGTYTLAFNAPGLAAATSTPITLVAGSANRLAFVAPPPGNATNGQPFGGTVAVALRDATGNPVLQAGVTITASIASGAGILSGPPLTAATDALGVATFAGLVITGQTGPYTLAFAATGVTPLVSATIQLAAGPATKLILAVAPPTTAVSGVALVPAPAVRLADVSGNPVSTAGVQVTATLATGTGTLAGATATTGATGTATFSTLTISGPAGSYSLAFAAPGLTGVTTAAITLGGASPTQLSFTVAPPGTATNGQPFGGTVAVALRDATGNPVLQAGVTITASIASGAGILSGPPLTAATDALGVATFAGLVITGQTGPYTLAFAATGVTPLVSATIQLAAGPATKLILAVAPPTTAVSGVALVPAPAVRLADVSGNPVSTAGVQVTATLATGTGTLAGATATTGATGTATFSTLTISGPAGSYSLAFAAPGLTGVTTAAITLGGASPTQLSFTVAPPGNATNGQPFGGTVAVALRDATGNPVLQAGVTITASIASGAGILSGPPLTAATDALGVATFAGLVITGQTGPYTLAFAATGVTPLVSATIQLAAGPATKLILAVAPPTTAVSGVALVPAPAVRLADVSGNPVSTAGVQVTATLATGTGTLAGATATTGATGTATFSTLTISGPAGSYSLAFAAPGLTGVTTAAITLGGASPTQLTFTVAPPGSAGNGQLLNPQPVLQLRDAGGVAVPQAGVQVTATASGLSTTGGTVSTNASGVATFSNLALSGLAGSHNLVFTAAGVPNSISSSITLTAGPATQLAFTTAPPATTPTGQQFAASLQVRDASGNAVAQSGLTVTAAIASGPAGVLSGTLSTVTNGSGVASFSDLVLTGSLGDYSLAFTSSGLSSATATVKLVAGAPAGIILTTQPSASATNDDAFGVQPVVTVADAGGNPVAGALVTASIASGPTGALGGTVSVTTNASGAATFTNLEIVGRIGDYTLQFASGGQSVTSGTVTLLAGVATQLVITVQPTHVTLLAPTMSPAPTVELRDSGSNLVPVDGRVVSVSRASGNSTFLFTPALTTGGVAVFTIVLLIDGQGNGDHTLRFSSDGLSVVSAAFKTS